MSKSEKPLKDLSMLGKALSERQVLSSAVEVAPQAPVGNAGSGFSGARQVARKKSRPPAKPHIVVDPNFKFTMLRERPNEPGPAGKKRARAAAAARPVKPEDLRGEAALRQVISAIRDVRFAIAEPRPTSVSQTTVELIKTRIAIGSDLLCRSPAPDPDGFIVGVDFGTSSTKVLVHQPFTAGAPTAALPVPTELRSEGVDHLWQTAVWFRPDTKRFQLSPGGGARLIDGFKAGLIQGLGGQSDVEGVPRCLAATAYLALLFAYVLGYYEQERPLGSIAADQFAAFHVGVPAAAQDDSRIRPEFLRISRAALALVPKAADLSLADVHAAYLNAGHLDDDKVSAGVSVFTELQGVIAGYLATRDRRPGAHMVVDVGASTLDVATFRLYEHDQDLRADVYAAAVEMLGAEALEWARAADVPDNCFRSACAHHAWSRFHYTRRQRDRGFDRTISTQPVTFLFVGGGRRTDLHRELFTLPSKDIYLGAPTQTPMPDNCRTSTPGVDFARLLVAYGLSRDPSEVPTFRLPSEVSDEPNSSKDVSDRFVSKDQI